VSQGEDVVEQCRLTVRTRHLYHFPDKWCYWSTNTFSYTTSILYLH